MKVRSKVIYNFFPLFIVFYAVISLLPKVDILKAPNEYFPFFSFDLYSLYPNEMIHYDLLINKESGDGYYLYFGNVDLDKNKAKFYKKSLWEFGLEIEHSGNINLEPFKEIIETANTVQLVKFSGRYSDLISNKNLEPQIIMEVK